MSHQYCEPVSQQSAWTEPILKVCCDAVSRWRVKIVQTTNMKKYGHCVECVKCFWCSPFLCGCVPLMVGDNVEMSNMDIEPLRYWVIKYSNTKCVHTFIHSEDDPFIFTIFLRSRLSQSTEMKCYIYFSFISDKI